MPRFSYDNGRYYRDGEPFFVVAADYQYYRDRRNNWPDRLDQLKAGQVNVITFYTPWRHHLQHDPVEGAISYDFIGETLDSRDLVHFMDLCAERGLYMIAKPGPFVHSELNIGGLPDVVSPSFNPEIEPVRMHDGAPLLWEYDSTQLPSPDDPLFDSLARAWLEVVGRVLAPHAAANGHLIGIQLLDETLYCTSNDPPWRFGYEPHSMQRFHQRLRERYGSIAEYNRVHETVYQDFSFVPAPRPQPGQPVADSRAGLLQYVDWAEHQWRVRRDAYALYREYLGLDLPYLSNFAGITPPIDENVPGQQANDDDVDIPPEYAPLYPEWWLAQNRVGSDRDVYHYGIISWLGVAAYNVSDASTEPPDDVGGNEVFHRYITTASRRRGINMEENWGFSKLYHPLSSYPIIPVFQTLVSLAGGCTGYVVFTGVCHDYWTDDLDRTTKLQHPTFPADAPIGPRGETGPMYEAMRLLNEYFIREGGNLLLAEPEPEICLLLVPEYAAISSWVPGDREWSLDNAIPRLGTGALEPATMILNRHGVTFKMAELSAMREEALAAQPRLALPSAFFLARSEQSRLIEYVRGGGKLILSGELPRFDELMEPCTLLADFAGTRPDGLILIPENVFGDEDALLSALSTTGWRSRLSFSEGLQASVHHNGDDRFVFFFHFGREPDADKQITIDGISLSLAVGPKTCGVVHLNGAHIVSYLIKAHNEYEGVEAAWRLACGDSDVSGNGDASDFDLQG